MDISGWRLYHVFFCLIASVAAQEGTKVRFENHGQEPVRLYWTQQGGARHGREIMGNGQGSDQDTFVGHTYHLVATGKELGGLYREVSILRAGTISFAANRHGIELRGDGVKKSESADHDPKNALSAMQLEIGKSVIVHFINRASKEMFLSWITPQTGEAKLVATAKPGERVSQNTETGHSFDVSFGEASGSAQRLIVRAGGDVIIAESGEATGEPLQATSLARYKGAKWDRIVSEQQKNCTTAFKGFPDDVAYFCSSRHDYRRLNKGKLDISDDEYAEMRVPKNQQNSMMLRDQPRTFQNFTKLGFKVTKIPAELHEKLLAFWEGKKYESVPEQSHDYAEAVMPARVTDSWLLNLPDELRQESYRWVRGIISDWTGVPAEDLEETAIYGIRMYHRNAVLDVHVDIRDTHALSAIMEIDRNDPEDNEPWPLEVTDHSGKVHYVPGRKGQLILYESATCPHGRQSPFPGRQMVNAFVHFRPKGWPDKYLASAAKATPLSLKKHQDL
eukprot:TRINITY_DN7527_c0_g1_i1.p1 TRINITY_DN7527_c0_g1~~TRINITY_DN7527_c0_g1_i1.p1  ORF type:complete len:505 (-),score=75.24 TRINITY_DN7527_c0_g1_i1:49-1563(-)